MWYARWQPWLVGITLFALSAIGKDKMGTRRYWPFNEDPESSWLESNDPRAQLLDQSVHLSCGSSAAACMYAMTASDDREDVLCNSCTVTCAAGFLKKASWRGESYTRVSKGYFYTAGWCFYHKLVRDVPEAVSTLVHGVTDAVAAILRYFYHELPHMYRDPRPYFNTVVQVITSFPPKTYLAMVCVPIMFVYMVWRFLSDVCSCLMMFRQHYRAGR